MVFGKNRFIVNTIKSTRWMEGSCRAFLLCTFFPKITASVNGKSEGFGSFDVLEVHGLKKGVLLKDYGREICEEIRSRRKQITKHDSGIAPSKLIPRHLS